MNNNNPSSSPLEFRRHQENRHRLLPRLGALDGAARFFRCGVGPRGSILLLMREDPCDAMSSRSFMPSGAAHAALVSGNPFDPAGDHKGWPSTLSPPSTPPGSSGTRAW